MIESIKKTLLKVKPNTFLDLLLLIILSILVSSCQDKPKEVLNRKKMEQLMYDIYIAEAAMEIDYQSFGSPEEKEAYINKVFLNRNVTQAQWDTSLSWYSDRIDLYLKMNDSVKARLKRAQTDVDSKMKLYNTRTVEPEPEIYSASYIPRVYSFKTPGTQKRGFRFQLDSTEISTRISDNFLSFNLKAIGIPSLDNSRLTSALTLVYSDTTVYKFQNIEENRSYNTQIPKYVNNDSLKQIFGFVHLESMPGNTPNIQLFDICLGSQ